VALGPKDPPLAVRRDVPNEDVPPDVPLTRVTPAPPPLPPPPTKETLRYKGAGPDGVVYVPDPEVNICVVGALKDEDPPDGLLIPIINPA
jgi:hypothetical protein